MELKPAFPAPEQMAFSVSFVGMPAHRTFLRGVSGIDKKNLFTDSPGFIPEKLFKFVERPIVQFPVELFASPFLNPDLRKVFQREDRVIRVRNLLRDAVIGISHKPSLPSGNLTEFPFCRSGAFGLQFLTKVSIFRPNALHLPGVEKRVVRTDSNIYDPTVDPEHPDLRQWGHIWMFHRDVQIERLLPPVIGERRSRDLPGEIMTVILRDRECCLDPSFHRCDGSNTMHQVHRDDPLVVPHGGERFSFWQGLTLNGFQSLTCTISRTLYQRGRKIRNRLTNNPVCCRVVLHLIPRTALEPPLCGGRERH